VKYALAACVLLSACTVKCTLGDDDDVSKVHLISEVKGANIEVHVEQTQGKRETEVCFDLTIRCPNGPVLKAPRTCVKVKDGGTVTATIPDDSLIGEGSCDPDKPAPQEFSNLTINGKPPGS
jgi:hypothetical protein